MLENRSCFIQISCSNKTEISWKKPYPGNFLYRQKNSEANISCNFEPHLYYSSLVWAQNSSSIKGLFVLQKKSLRVIYFLNHNAHTSSSFRELNILKLPDKTALENCLFINKYPNKCLPTIFKNWFTLSSDFHTYNIRWSNLGCIVVPPHNIKLYDCNWTRIQNHLVLKRTLDHLAKLASLAKWFESSCSHT